MLVVLNDGSGQMCNKLLMQANVLASAMTRGYKVKYYNMQKFDGFKLRHEKLDDYVTIVQGNPGKLYTAVRAIHKGLSKLSIYSKKFVMVSGSHQFEGDKLLSSNYLTKHTSYLYGWPFYDLESLRTSGDVIRKYLAPSNDIEAYINNTLDEIDAENSIVIGMHLRRGDYKNWRNGLYYYSDEQYKMVLEKIIPTINTEKRIIVLFFSNESLDVNYFSSRTYEAKLMQGNAAQDFHLMAKCNVLIGPPSSFSGLASFLGKVPRYMIEDCKAPISKDNLLVWLEETDSWGLPTGRRIQNDSE